ncbi:MAG: hypothetical protein Q7R96_04645 [Nanoarchaeota archaeon]|nr:hypothetical protein [Nanoarchaeota archaeon]
MTFAETLIITGFGLFNISIGFFLGYKFFVSLQKTKEVVVEEPHKATPTAAQK